jgi:uncharacterized membrane protein
VVGLTLYLGLKFIHVLLAIVAVGFNMSYGIWISRAAKEPQHEAHVLRGIKLLDDRIANPAYGLLLVTGVTTVLVGHLSFAQFWIAMALGLYGLLTVVAAAVFTPTLRKQIEALETEGRESATFAKLASRAQVTGIFLAVTVLAIVFLMVTKPTF